MKKKIAFATLVSLVLAACATSWAGEITPTLQSVLDETPAGETVRALVIMSDQAPLESLSATLSAQGAPRKVRHEMVVRALQDVTVTQEPLLEWIYQGKFVGDVVDVQPFWIANIIAIEATPDVLIEISLRDDVEEVEFDFPIELIDPVDESPSTDGGKGIEPGVSVINADDLWALGIDGTGTLVSHLDTGVQGGHPALDDRWRGLDSGVTPGEAWFDPVAPISTFPFDSGSHGTHTMGTICGDDGGSNQIGVAPGAKWISAGVIDLPGATITQTYERALAAFQWVADPDGDPGTVDDVPDVCSNSWGLASWHGYPDCDNTLWSAIDGAEAAGVVVLFAAGNEGSTADTIRIPADRITSAYNTFAVGALYQGGTSIASYSSRGPSNCDHSTIKPEACAVGDNVRSSVPTSSYGTKSGTSMATPHMAGVVALLRQDFPDTTVDQVKEAIMMTAVDLGAAGEDNTYGKGRVDALAAYNYLKALCDVDDDGFVGEQCGGPDCDDNDPAVNPDSEEICDGLDNNCDGAPGEDEADADEDGYMVCEDDCDDNNAAVNPDAEEICDGLDNNCDEALGEGEVDADEDGYMVCEDDCDDSNAAVYPGAEEACDGVDNNCDGTIDEGCGDDDNDDDDSQGDDDDDDACCGMF